MWLIIHGTPCHLSTLTQLSVFLHSIRRAAAKILLAKCIGLLKGTLIDQAALASEVRDWSSWWRKSFSFSSWDFGGLGCCSGRCRFLSGSRNGKHPSSWGCSSAGTSMLSYWDKQWWLKGQLVQDMLQHQAAPTVLYLADRKISWSNLSMKASLAISIIKMHIPSS